MAEQRPLLLVLLPFAISLGALGAAAGSAAARCGGNEDCSYELALALFALAPASLIGILVVFLMRMRAELRWLRTLLLAVGVGVASIPLAGFLLRDLWMFPAFAALLAALVVLALLGEREAAADERWAAVPPTAEEGAPAAGVHGAPRLGEQPATGALRADRTLAFLAQMADLNSEILRLCEALPRPGREPAKN